VAEARQHKLVIDQPAEDGATDHGMTPAELLLVSLGSCAGQYVAQYLQLRGLPSDGLLVRVEAQLAVRPRRLKDFAVKIIVPGLNERQLRALQKSLPSGLVQQTLGQENVLQITAATMHSGDVDA
jgi:uncharacterized OsmC-like protein